MSDNLNEALNDLNNLFENEYSLEEKEKKIELTLPYKKGDIKFVLKEIDDNMDISYNNLSEYMKKKVDENGLILGIDLGTTYSCASIMIDKNIIMIRNSLGSTTTPSFIAFMNKYEVYVGELAKLLPSNAKNIIYNTKRLIGKNIDDKEIKEIMKNLSFNLKEDKESKLLKIELDFSNEKEKEININDKRQEGNK